jgi:plastocyanin
MSLWLRVQKAVSAAVICLVLAGCGGGSSSATPTPTGPSPAPAAPEGPGTTAIVTITAAGVSPKEVTIASGGRVTFINNDVRPHDIAGGPDPAHPDCPEIDAVAFLTPGQQRATAPFGTARTCEYHDHSFHSSIMTGTIVIR